MQSRLIIRHFLACVKFYRGSASLNTGDIIAATINRKWVRTPVQLLSVCGPKYTTLGHIKSETMPFARSFNDLHDLHLVTTCRYRNSCLDGAAFRRGTRDRKVAGSTPGRSAIKSTRSTQPSIPPV